MHMTIAHTAQRLGVENVYRLENLFGVSFVNVQQLDGEMPEELDGWQKLSMNIPTDDPTRKVAFSLLVRARSSDHERCPRCYLHTRLTSEPICGRCTDVLRS